MNLWIYESMNLWIYESMNLWIYESMNLWIYESMNLWIHESMNLWIYESMNLWIYESMNLWIYLSIYLSLSLSRSVCPSIYLPVYLQDWKPSYSARFLHFSKLTTSKPQQFCVTSSFFQSWQHQKRSSSARLPHSSKLTTSDTKQFCDTSSFFELGNIQNEAILRVVFIFQSWQHQKGRVDGLVPIHIAIFPFRLSKVLHLPRNSDARSYEVLHLSRKIILAKLKIWCSKMQRLSGNQRPDLLTALMKMSLVLRLPRKMHLCRSSSNLPRLSSFLKCHKTLTFCSLLRRCTITCACYAKRHLNLQKWSEPLVF